MRSTPLLPMPFDRDFERRSKFRILALPRRALSVCTAIIGILCCILIFARLPRLEFELPSFSSNYPKSANITPDKILSTSVDSVWSSRASQVKKAFVSAYAAYDKVAYPHDELLPISNGFQDNLNGWGASSVDGLDTMLLMGLDDLSSHVMNHVTELDFTQNEFVQFFETVIRYLGGLLSSYALTGESILLSRADELGKQLLPVFNSSSGLPPFAVNVQTGTTRDGWAGHFSILSEMASCQMEYRYLAHLTGRPEYVTAVDHITDILQRNEEHGGLFALMFDLSNGYSMSNTYSVGAMADSAYEYLLKQWLMTGRTESRYLDMYLKSADAIISNLLYVSPSRKLLYVTDAYRRSLAPVGDLQHLSCFIAGLFALGAATTPNVDPRHAWAAEGLAHTCWITYAESATGLGPERVIFSAPGRKWVDEIADWEQAGKLGDVPPGVNQTQPVQQGQDKEYRTPDARYLLRPETIESFYVLWRTTGDDKWRDRGWALFEAIEKHAKLDSAYASIKDVNQVPATHTDEMPSFFFAETLKYAYLLFTDEDILPLDKWTFNTEAHAFPNFEWSQSELEKFGIRLNT